MSSVKIQGSATGTAAFTIAVPDGTSTDRTITLPDAAGSFVLADGTGDVAVSGVQIRKDTASTTNELLRLTNANGSTTDGVKITMEVANTSGNGGEIGVVRDGGSFNPYMYFSTSSGVGSAPTERMRINNAGQITMGGSSHADDILYLTRSNDGKVQRFFRGASEVGYISVTSSSTSYNTSSDYRLKENVADLTGAIDRVKQVPVHRFNFIADPDRTVDGFLAHEVQSIVPEAVTGTQDGMRTEEYEVTPAVLDDDGNVVTEAVMGTREVPDYQGIDQSKLVPLLTAAIKEQQALIEDLQTRLAALEAV